MQASRDALPVLLELGADPKAIDPNNRTRLHYCIDSLYHGTCAAEDIPALLKLGLDAKLADNTGSTPLHLLLNYREVPDKTSRYGQKRKATVADLLPLRLIQMLLDGGADPDAQTLEGLTPAMYGPSCSLPRARASIRCSGSGTATRWYRSLKRTVPSISHSVSNN